MTPLAVMDAAPAQGRAEFYGRLKSRHLSPLWEVLAKLVPPRPNTSAVAVKWSYPELRPSIAEACRLITAAEAERRVLILENPGLAGQAAATATLYAGLQAILPGEQAPAHRHTQSALRFIMEGGGAFTALNGERVIMQRYDLVLTPSWIWHDHGNESSVPMVWLDGLDIPLIRSLDAGFSEHRPDRGVHPHTRPDGDSRFRWGANLRPTRLEPDEERRNPVFAYPYAAWRPTLEAARSGRDPHPHDAYVLEFANPVDGGPALDTMSAFAQLVPAGFETRRLRSSDSSVQVVVEGRGRMEIGGRMFDVAEGDILVVPTWETRRLCADSDMVLFSYSDRATHQKLNLWREELL